MMSIQSDHNKYLSQSGSITAYMVVGPQISILASLTVLLLTWLSDHK